ncbi:MAG: GntR family transcriptional regulator [Spirochaetales bacterium]|nr:GntR family transcriptional regulator [Spirochaetales bacterium]
MEDVIIQELLNSIHNGEYIPGDRLPSEHSLASRYDVPRSSIRMVYARLEEQGYAGSVQGKGWFLRRQRLHLHLDLAGNRSFTEKLFSSEQAYSPHNLGVRKIIRDDKIWEILGAGKSEEVMEISLLRIIDSEPAAIHNSFLRKNLFPDIPDIGTKITSMYKYFQDNGYSGFSSEHIVMQVSFPDIIEQQILDCPSLVPLLRLEYFTCSEGTVLQYNRIAYRSDRFSFSL